MPGIPRRDSLPDSAYPSQHVGRRASEMRRVRNMSQDEIADRMVTLGHSTWRRQTVSQVESADRSLTVDELVSLAVVLESTVSYLFDPASLGSGLPGEKSARVDLGFGHSLDADAYTGVLGFVPKWSTSAVEVDVSYDWSDIDDPHIIMAKFTVRQEETTNEQTQT